MGFLPFNATQILKGWRAKVTGTTIIFLY